MNWIWNHQPLAGSDPQPWTERRFGACAFPFDGPEGSTLSCCLPVVGGSSWCKGHRAIVFTKALPHEPKHHPKNRI